jgi:hypothetical protein
LTGQGAPPQCFGPEASARTKSLLPTGVPVRVEFDAEPTDKFGRSLVYLYRDDKFVNAELVRDGFARAKTFKPNVRYKAELAQLQSEAKAAGAGLWGSCESAKASAGGLGFDQTRAAVAKVDAERPARTPAERKQREAAASSRELTNPGDTKNCAVRTRSRRLCELWTLRGALTVRSLRVRVCVAAGLWQLRGGQDVVPNLLPQVRRRGEARRRRRRYPVRGAAQKGRCMS